MKFNVGFFQSLMKNVKNLKLSIYFLLLKKSFRFILSFIYFRYLLFYSNFDVVFYHLFDLWNAEGPTFGNKMVPSEGSHGSEGESSKNLLLKFFKKVKALFHLKKESIPPQAEPITPESLLQIEINPNDTPNELREKAAFLLSSYYAEAKIYRDHYVWLDIVQHLAFERNGQNNVSREDLVGLIEALKDPANEGGELYLKSKKFLLKDDHRYNKSLKIE